MNSRSFKLSAFRTGKFLTSSLTNRQLQSIKESDRFGEENDNFRKIINYYALHEKCPYSEFFWSVISPNVGKYGPEIFRIWTLFTQ